MHKSDSVNLYREKNNMLQIVAEAKQSGRAVTLDRGRGDMGGRQII